MKTIFIADAHIKGLKDPEMIILSTFLDDLEEVETLVILGDLFDFWTGSNSVVLSEYKPLIKSLMDLHSHGTDIIYIEGNHDFSMGEFFTETLGASVHPNSAGLMLDGKRVYLSHGDTVNMNAGYWLWRSFLRSSLFKFLTSIIPPETVWNIAKDLSKKSRSRDYGSGKPAIERNLKRFAELQIAKGFDVCILAHSHVGGVHDHLPTKENKYTGIYANPGGWINEKSYLVYEDGEFRTEVY